MYGIDRATGQQGYNLAAVMLFGKDDVIQDVVPAYVTDALVRRVDRDRYDDREIVKTNLIESYEQLMGFARKHLPDKFFLEGDRRKSLRNIIAQDVPFTLKPRYLKAFRRILKKIATILRHNSYAILHIFSNFCISFSSAVTCTYKSVVIDIFA